MIAEYVSAASGKVLDVITIPEDGPIAYANGAARARVETFERVAQDRAALIEIVRSWSNGYFLLREKTTPQSR